MQKAIANRRLNLIVLFIVLIFGLFDLKKLFGIYLNENKMEIRFKMAL